MRATKKGMAVLMAVTIIAVAGISIAPLITPEAFAATNLNSSKSNVFAQEAGHWGTIASINQEACTNEANQMKAPDDRGDRFADSSTDNQVQEIGTQSAECGDVSQSAEINNSVVDESTTNGDSTNTNSVNEGDPIPDIG